MWCSQDGHWGISQRYTRQSNNLLAYPCPSGYCRCSQDHDSLGNNLCSFAYFNSNPDKQCNCDREGSYTLYVWGMTIQLSNTTTGYLCGDCRDGKGVSALLNNCVDCSNTNSVLIAVLSKNLKYMYATDALNVCSISSHCRCSHDLSLVVQRCHVLNVALSNYFLY